MTYPRDLTDEALLRAFHALPVPDDGTHDEEGEAIIAEIERRNLDI